MRTCEIVKSCAGATRWRARRGGSGRRARRSPRVMVLLLLMVVLLLVVQEHGHRWFPFRFAVLYLLLLLCRWRRRRRPPAAVVVPRTLVGHGGLPLLGHQASGHGQPSSEISPAVFGRGHGRKLLYFFLYHDIILITIFARNNNIKAVITLVFDFRFLYVKFIPMPAVDCTRVFGVLCLVLRGKQCFCSHCRVLSIRTNVVVRRDRREGKTKIIIIIIRENKLD